ncbi:MAG: cytochrome d ubiquinol oxidase subunit II [Desulfosarcina sp.]|nr:cytochrome d ubiquinol oxidase subunit II [Desulfobacterales bacterium]
MDFQAIWFFLWGLLWALFFMTSGFDFGIGTLLPFIGKTDEGKRTMIASLGPLWHGNQVWLITAGGVTFAAFPLFYAVMFSTLYSALMLILFALILRGVAIGFRSQNEDPRWKRLWETCIFIGSFGPALLFGVAFANIFQGIPFDGQGVYHGTLLTLLNPYGLLGGVLFVLLFLQHGAIWLAIRTGDALQQRAIAVAKKVWPLLVVVTVAFLVASWFATNLYANYLSHPALFLDIGLTVLALLAARVFMARQAWFKAWAASALTIVGAMFFGVIGLFPNLFPSSLDAAFSLTARNASASPLALKIMLVVVIVFLPIVLIYQVWAYKLFQDKVSAADLAHEKGY